MEVDVQLVSTREGVPLRAQLESWARAALGACDPNTELTLRIVDEEEIAELNRRFRLRPGPTNVLSFGFQPPPGVDTALLGDVVICAPIVAREAREQGKPEMAHWAHMVVHGVLHLLGHDHEHHEDAREMEELETQILEGLGYADPYRMTDTL